MTTATPLRPTARPLDEIVEYRNERVLERYVIDHGGTMSDARDRFEALKQFMIVCSVKPGIKVTSAEIDDMWHTFLLFTIQYREFCSDWLGRFIEHEPFEAAQPEYYGITRSFAHDLFGELDARFWPAEGKADCSSGCGT